MGRKARLRSKLRDEDVEELEELLEKREPGPAAEEKAQLAKEATATESDGPAAKVLELQKTAGNRATAEAISRWPLFGALMAQWPKERQVIFDGVVIPLEAMQEQMQNPTSASSATPSKTDSTGPGEITITIKQGEWSSKLFQDATQGGGFKTVEIVLPTKDGKGVRIILSDVLISSYSISGHGGSADGPIEGLTLNFKKRAFSEDPPPRR